MALTGEGGLLPELVKAGIWVQAPEGTKFWAGACAELRNHGIRDVLIVCCDGLTRFPETIEDLVADNRTNLARSI